MRACVMLLLLLSRRCRSIVGLLLWSSLKCSVGHVMREGGSGGAREIFSVRDVIVIKVHDRLVAVRILRTHKCCQVLPGSGTHVCQHY